MDADNKYGNLEIQKYYLPMLDYVDEVCRKNDIKYTLSDGSLIGAVRHGGFVPWDDDIDISFDRENYHRFLAAVKKDRNGRYKIVRDMWVYRMTAKDNPYVKEIPPRGCLDFFVFDNVPDSRIKDRIKSLLLKMLQGMLKREVSYEGFSAGYKLMLFTTHVFGRFFKKKTKQKWYDKVAQWDNGKQTAQKARYYCSFRYISNVRYPADITDEYTFVEFEGKKYMALKEWEKFLSTDYGDFMQLPPEEKRVPKHKH